MIKEHTDWKETAGGPGHPLTQHPDYAVSSPEEKGLVSKEKQNRTVTKRLRLEGTLKII